MMMGSAADLVHDRRSRDPRVVHFLAADQSAYITGAVWGVNGGQDM